MKTIMIQNVDRIVRPRDYEHLNHNELLVTSIFRTIQGEGPLAGQPAVFLRLAGCNFGDKEDHCQGCDTSFHYDKGQIYEFEDLYVAITGLPGYSKSDILVVTGGEPTLQENLFSFVEGLAGELVSKVQIETNGTQVAFFKHIENYEESLWSSADLEEVSYVRPTIIVSPKASMKANRYAEPSELVKRYASCFKFVLSADEMDPHYLVPEWALELSWLKQKPVYVSPLAVYKKPYQGEVASAWDHSLIDAEKTARNYSYAAKYAMENNLLLSIQQHLFLGIA